MNRTVTKPREEKEMIMSKKVWISLPLISAEQGPEASVSSFLKGGQRKELEVETAAFIMKWLLDKEDRKSVV
mgnify:CR=1 FL=1